MKSLDIILYATFFIFTISCSSHSDRKEISISELKFDTTDASEIFFSNVRKPSYNLEELKEEGINLYFPKTEDQELENITPYLVHNWRYDRAYIMLKGVDNFDKMVIRLKSDTVEFESVSITSPADQTKFSIKAYNTIITNDTLQYRRNSGNWGGFFLDDKQKELFRITCYDFLRLVELQ